MVEGTNDKPVDGASAREPADPVPGDALEGSTDAQTPRGDASGDAPGGSADRQETPIEADENFPPHELAGEEEPGQMDIEIDPESSGEVPAAPAEPMSGAAEPDRGEAVAADGRDSGGSASGADETPAAGEGDPVCPREQLENARARLMSTLFARDRPRSSEVDGVIESFVSALGAAVTDGTVLADELSRLTDLVAAANRIACQQEQAGFKQAGAGMADHVAAYDTLFSELDALVRDVGGELEQLDGQSAPFQAAPEPLQAELANYRKGVEIIHRMLSRVRDRKKDVPAEPGQTVAESLQSPDVPHELDGVGGFLKELTDRYHKLRDSNYHVVNDTAAQSDKCHGQVLQVVNSLLAAIDGIDGGLQAEEETREQFFKSAGDDEACRALVESWTGCYGRLNQIVDGFFARAGIEAQTVDVGTPFDAETMEPQGTVQNPELNDEDVAAVMRRGFSMNGHAVRPILVDVVRNS